MISFNNISLEQIAPVKIVDVLVSPIPLSPVARQRPIRFGADYVRMGGQPRTAAITFALLEQDLQEILATEKAKLLPVLRTLIYVSSVLMSI